MILLFSISHGDYIKKKTLACPSIMLIKKAMHMNLQEPLELDMYSIANDCVILSNEDKIQAIGYDPRSSKEIFQKILFKKTEKVFYIIRSAIEIEQSGKKNILRF